MGRVADQPGLLLRPRGAVDIAADFAPLWIADRDQIVMAASSTTTGVSTD